MMKQGEENTRLIKEENNKTEKYIFQKNTKTKIGASIIISVLIVIVIAIVFSGVAI